MLQVLPAEVLHGITFATAWGAGCAYCQQLSPPGAQDSLLACLPLQLLLCQLPGCSGNNCASHTASAAVHIWGLLQDWKRQRRDCFR